ncbi:MAG TPA: hypothetical protein PKV79_01425, partial [Candidatus Marinimicrobia bacterium]|nr:hypothetical protein [Candidatus Neomarinimicrobiota bacterium]
PIVFFKSEVAKEKTACPAHAGLCPTHAGLCPATAGSYLAIIKKRLNLGTQIQFQKLFFVSSLSDLGI